MDPTNPFAGIDPLRFAIWFGAIAAVLGSGMGAMLWAYRGEGSRAVLFDAPVDPDAPADSNSGESPVAAQDPARDPTAIAAFQQGRDRFAAGDYRQAADAFAIALQRAPDWPEACHNHGLCLANLRDDDDATRSLARAGNLYLDRGDRRGSAQVRRHLSAILDRKRGRDTARA